MCSTRVLNITLPTEMAEAVRAKVASGVYATASELIREGLLMLFDRDRAIELWLRNEVVSACDELRSDPLSTLTPTQVQEHLAQTRRTRDGEMS